MRKQVLFIHGAMSFSDPRAFVEYLNTTAIRDPFAAPPRRWKDHLRESLADVADVMAPSMPNKQNAKYAEWEIWFLRHMEFLRDDAILVGHSQGGYFLAKYLSEHTPPIRIRALYLVAAPAGPDDFGGEDGGDFAFDMRKFRSGVADIADIFILHAKDDPVVPFSHALRYHEAVPEATLIPFEGRGHFLSEEFPELIESIRNLPPKP